MLLCGLSSATAVAADIPSGSTKVGLQVVTPLDIDRELARTIPKLPEDPLVVAKLQAAARKECVRRELALQWLEAQKLAVGEATIDTQLQRRKKELAAQETTWATYLQQVQHTEASLRRETKWRLSWKSYLSGQLTDTNLERYFDKHRAEFDGTQVRVAHLLLKAPAEPSSQNQWDKIHAQALEIREEIAAGKLTFADAVKKYSQAPTAEQGGEIGFIERHKPMPESFAKAAFALQSQEISRPVETAFGVYLIQCLEIKPGELPWTAAREELNSTVTRYLFDWICEKQADKVRVEYLDTKSYDPGSIKLPRLEEERRGLFEKNR